MKFFGQEVTFAEHFVVVIVAVVAVAAAAAERLAVFARTVRALVERQRFALRPWQSMTCHAATTVER